MCAQNAPIRWRAKLFSRTNTTWTRHGIRRHPGYPCTSVPSCTEPGYGRARLVRFAATGCIPYRVMSAHMLFWALRFATTHAPQGRDDDPQFDCGACDGSQREDAANEAFDFRSVVRSWSKEIESGELSVDDTLLNIVGSDEMAPALLELLTHFDHVSLEEIQGQPTAQMMLAAVPNRLHDRILPIVSGMNRIQKAVNLLPEPGRRPNFKGSTDPASLDELDGQLETILFSTRVPYRLQKRAHQCFKFGVALLCSTNILANNDFLTRHDRHDRHEAFLAAWERAAFGAAELFEAAAWSANPEGATLERIPAATFDIDDELSRTDVLDAFHRDLQRDAGLKTA